MKKAIVLFVLAVGAAFAVESAGAQSAGPGPLARPLAPVVAAALDAAAAETNLPTSDILSALRRGETLAALVTEAGGDVQAVIEATAAAATDEISALAASGRLAQERADALLADVDALAADAIHGELAPGLRGRLHHLRHAVRLGVQRALIDAVTESTGLGRAEVIAALRDGQTLADVVTASGGSAEAVVAAAAGSLTAHIDAAVADGTLTREAADALIAELPDRLTEAMNASPVRERMWLHLLRDALDVAADQTGLTPRELHRLLGDGTALADVFESNGGDPAAFVNELMERAEAHLLVLVAEDRLAADEATALLGTLRTDIEARLAQPWSPARARRFV